MAVISGSAMSRSGLAARRAPARHRVPAAVRYVLDADDDLADELDVRMRVAARQVATARVLDAQAGDCDLGPWFAARR